MLRSTNTTSNRGGDTEVAEQRARIEAGLGDDELDRFKSMLDKVPINVMTCSLEDFTIDYANDATLESIKSLEHVLNIKASQLVGSCIDVFHKNPAHQRKLLADPRNLPHNAQIEIGDEVLNLYVTAITNAAGKYLGPCVTWKVITEEVAAEVRITRLMSMLDNMPVNVMACDKDTLELDYINKTSKDTLRPLQSLLPVPVDQLEGTCIDAFHKNPSVQRRLLGDERNLPYRTKISLGEHILDLQVSAVRDGEGVYIGPMAIWSVVTDQIKMIENFETNVKTVIDQVSAAATEMEASSGAMQDSASNGSERSVSAMAASQQATGNMESIASATEEMTTSVDEIAQSVTNSAQIATTAVDESRDASTKIQGLAEAANKISSVVDLITDIASQTNLLALNATIEAARAGEAGKGFAVVASEVKSLANQTSQATEDISAQIDSIQSASKEGVDAIEGITTTIEKMNELASAVASAVEEQGAATREISRNIQEASRGIEGVSSNVSDVNEVVSETGTVASQVREAAGELAQQASVLSEQSDAFLEEIKKL